MTTAVIVTSFIVLTLPIAAVFLIDEAFVASDYAEAVLIAAGVGLATSFLILPIAFAFERLVMRGGTSWKVLAVCVPMASPAASAMIFVLLFKLQPPPAVGHALSIAVLLLMSFSVYWLSLWSLSAVHYGAWRLSQRMIRGRRLDRRPSRS
ncbi:hypothetical protein ACWGB8_04735 [Kitasatospora sp. NPDC054939]